MLLKLHDSKLFTIDPAIRFAEQYNVSQKIWNGVWSRYLEGYDEKSLAGYILYETGRKISLRSLKRWINRTEIYCRANHIMLMGVRVVSSEYFKEFEQFLIEEVLNNMKYAGTQDSRIMV